MPLGESGLWAVGFEEAVLRQRDRRRYLVHRSRRRARFVLAGGQARVSVDGTGRDIAAGPYQYGGREEEQQDNDKENYVTQAKSSVPGRQGDADIPCVTSGSCQQPALKLFDAFCQSVVIILRGDVEVGPHGPLGVV